MAKKDYYEVLGLSRTASAEEIKKRFRELVRKYHPDVAGDKALSAKEFARITEAYKTLSDPVMRRSYDRTLIDVKQRVQTAQPGAHHPPGTAVHKPTVRPDIAKLIKDAEVAFIRHHLDQAKDLCKQAISIDKNCARAHAILGDIFRAKHLPEQAINEYSYAIQFDPTDNDSKKKLEKLLERSAPVTFSWEDGSGRMSNEAIILNIIGWSFTVFFLLLVSS